MKTHTVRCFRRRCQLPVRVENAVIKNGNTFCSGKCCNEWEKECKEGISFPKRLSTLFLHFPQMVVHSDQTIKEKVWTHVLSAAENSATKYNGQNITFTHVASIVVVRLPLIFAELVMTNQKGGYQRKLDCMMNSISQQSTTSQDTRRFNRQTGGVLHSPFSL